MSGIDINRLVAALPPITCPQCGQSRPATEPECAGCGTASPAMNGNRELIGPHGLLMRDLAGAVLDIGPICAGIGGQLYFYRRGVWLPGGADEVYRRTRRLLGNRWRKAHAENIVAWFASDEPFVTDELPTHVINTQSGLLDWRTGALVPHTPELATTFQVPHRWDPDATCPAVDRWLGEVLPADAIPLGWEVLGYLLYPDNPFHVAGLLHGSGRNGKGTWLSLARHLLGPAHVSAVTLQALGESRFAGAQLYGKVANLAGDLDARSISRTDLFKMATGGDPIDAEYKYGRSFTFTCRATFVFAANELPGTADMSEGFFSRWLVIPFVAHFPPGQADPYMRDRLHAETPGVLVKAVNGLRRLMERGRFDLPESVVAATADYRRSADPVRQYVADRIDLDPDSRTPRRDVYLDYLSWVDHNGHRPLAAGRFYDRFLNSCPGSWQNTVGGVRMLAGVRLLAGEGL